MEQKQLFKAVDEGRADQIFFADTTDGQAPFKVVGKDEQDHGEGVRQVRHDKIRQECVGLSAGALHAGDLQTDHFRSSIREGDKAAFIAAPFAAGSFCAAERAGHKKQRGLCKGRPKQFFDRKDPVFQLAIKGI